MCKTPWYKRKSFIRPPGAHRYFCHSCTLIHFHPRREPHQVYTEQQETVANTENICRKVLKYLESATSTTSSTSFGRNPESGSFADGNFLGVVVVPDSAHDGKAGKISGRSASGKVLHPTDREDMSTRESMDMTHARRRMIWEPLVMPSEFLFPQNTTLEGLKSREVIEEATHTVLDTTLGHKTA